MSPEMTISGIESRAAVASGDRVHHAGADVGEQDAGLSGGAGVTVGGVCGGLLVAGDHELDRAGAERVQQGDVGVATGAEDVLDSVRLQLAGQGFGGGHGHASVSPSVEVVPVDVVSMAAASTALVSPHTDSPRSMRVLTTV